MLLKQESKLLNKLNNLEKTVIARKYDEAIHYGLPRSSLARNDHFLLSSTTHIMKKLLFTMFYAITALVSLSTFLHGSDTYAAACPDTNPGCNDAIC